MAVVCIARVIMIAITGVGVIVSIMVVAVVMPLVCIAWLIVRCDEGISQGRQPESVGADCGDGDDNDNGRRRDGYPASAGR
jgi:hypothetical protein